MKTTPAAVSGADLSQRLYDALEARYRPPSYAFIPQVRNSTGFPNVVRTADAVAMGLWPSRGMDLHGFEIKIDRGDWLRELRNPAKADEIAEYCDRWWVVIASREIVQTGELPPTWGLLYLRGKTLRCEVEAPKLKASPINRPFLAALLRRVTEVMTPEAKIAAAVRKARAEEREKARKDGEHLYESLERRIREFQEASGVKIDYWNAGNIGAAVKTVLDGPMRMRDLRSLRDTARFIIQRIDQALEETQPAELAEVE